MQAIILAAGMGRRLGELTKDNTKCMVPVNGVRLIDRLLGQLSNQDLKRIIIVVGYKGNELREYVNAHHSSLPIEFYENPVYDKTNNIYSLAIVKEQLQEDDTLLIESDLIFSDRLIPMIVENAHPNLALVAKYETWMDGTMVRLDDEQNIVNFISKDAFDYNDVDSYYKTVNIYKLSQQFSQQKYVPFLDAYTKAVGNNEYYENVLRIISLLNGHDMKALPIGNEKWYEIDDKQDLDIAEALFADEKDVIRKYYGRYGGFWRFPNLLDFCYLVNPYFPTKRMRDEMRANFDTLLTVYPSGMFVNSLLAGKYFGIKQDYIVVGNGAAELIKVVMEEHTGKKVGVMFPTFDEYPNRLKPEQIVPFISHKDNFSYTVDELMDFFGDKNISLLLLINPDNPSGQYIQKKDVLRLADWCKEKGIKLIVDESFVDFTDGYEDNTLLHNDILEKYPDLMVMKSISKSYGVPGLRLGVFVSSNKELIARIKKEVSIWNINSFGEFYMQIFGKYENDYKRACKLFREEREKFFKDLQTIPYLRVIPSQANYFLCEVTDKYTSAELTQKLIEHDVIISNCSLKRNMGGSGKQLIRLAVRDRKDDEKLVNILKSL